MSRKNTNVPQPILVVGVGNILMKDDGVGIRVIETLMQRSDMPSCVEIIDGGTAGFDLLSYMKKRRKIIIVDSLKFDGESGSVYRFTPDELMQRQRGFSLHDVGIIEVIRALRLLGENPNVEIVGIVGEDISLDIGLSESVARAVHAAVQLVMKIIHETLEHMSIPEVRCCV